MLKSGLSKLLLLAGAAALVRGVARRSRRIDLRGRTVIVTGGSRGLGLQLAAEFGRQGANVAICGREASAVRAAEAHLSDLGIQVLAHACDLSDRFEADAFVDDVARTFGRIDVLVNNAGIIQVGPLETATVERFTEAMKVNLFAAINVTTRALGWLREQGDDARIVNVTSIGGRLAMPHMLPYDTSKFAFFGFSEGLRAELDAKRPSPRVVTVVPGLMRTGSYYNGEFSGQRQREFAWFSVAASMPLLSIDARVAARRIVRATRDGRAFLRFALSAHAGELLHRLSPGLAVWMMGLAARFLPGPGDEDASTTKGRDLHSPLAGSRLLRLGDEAAKRNNEVPSDGAAR